MLGDPLLNSVDEQLRRLSLNEVSGTTGSYRSLASIGITTDSSGKLILDPSKLQTALQAQPNAVAQLFGASTGIAARLDTALTQVLASNGAVAARDKSLSDDQKVLEQQKTRHDQRMNVVQQRYLVQFNALDAALAEMKKTSSFLTEQLASNTSSS
jgi:flagellar hook-associated protein 2